jgi:myo-inositol 2-dehydrogenase / D-chiro-inositol 1-dehydrogenase
MPASTCSWQSRSQSTSRAARASKPAAGRRPRPNRCFLVDFQTRADEYYIECIKRVHEGALGTFAFGESIYHAGIPWAGQISLAKEAPDHPETQLRAWGLFRVTSGDIITEQNIHTLDVMSWIMNQPPVCAFGTGGRKVREFGDCWDTFSVTFQYPNNVGIAFSSRQFDGFGTQPEGIRNRMFGTLGVLETSYGGETLIRGKNFYRGGSSPPSTGTARSPTSPPSTTTSRTAGTRTRRFRKACAAIW